MKIRHWYICPGILGVEPQCKLMGWEPLSHYFVSLPAHLIFSTQGADMVLLAHNSMIFRNA